MLQTGMEVTLSLSNVNIQAIASDFPAVSLQYQH